MNNMFLYSCQPVSLKRSELSTASAANSQLQAQRTLNHKHFSLIEMLVVMIILTLTIGLTGPFAMEMVERNDRKAEELKLIQACKKFGQLAYLKSEKMQIILQGRRIEMTNESDEVEFEASFKSISFKETYFTISKTGFASVPSVVTVRGQVVPLNYGR